MERTIDAPFGRVPGSVFTRFVALDGLIHGGGLSTAVGQPYDPPTEVAADVARFAHEALGLDRRER